MGFFDDSSDNGDNENPFANPAFGADSNELSLILSQPNLDPKTREMAMRVKGMEDRVRQAGLDPSLTEPRSSFFGDLLDTLDAPRQGVAGVIDTLFRGDMFGTDANTGESVGTGFRRGQIENTTTSDILRRNDLIDNPILRGIAGFAGDILTDPLTYLTLGAGAGARAGGKVLTEEGSSLVRQAHERLAMSGIVDPIERSNQIDDAIKAAARFQETASKFDKAGPESVRALDADQMSKAMDSFGKVFSPEEVIGRDLFAKKSLKIGANIPFLGHLTGAEAPKFTEEILKEQGPVGQAFRLLGKIWKPGKVNIGDFRFSDEALDTFSNISKYANNKLADVGAQLGKLKDIPVIGGGVSAAEAIGKRAKSAFQASNDLFKKIFYQKGLVGADANTNRLNYMDARAAAKVIARDKTFETLGEDLIANKAAQKEIFLAIDGQMMDAARAGIANAPKDTQKQILDTINKIQTTGEVSEGDQLILRQFANESGAEEQVRARIANVLNDPNVAPEVKDGIQRTMKAMDETAAEDAASGLGYSALEYYLPHKYMSLGSEAKNVSSAGKADSFLKKRTYNSITDAFETSGKVADTSLADLLKHRFEKSLVLRQQRNYAQRLMIEEGLNPDLVSKVYKEALLDPKGAAAQALKRYRIELKPIDIEAMKDAAVTAERQKVYAKIGLANDPEASRLVAMNASDFEQKVHQDMWASGDKPLDNLIPQEALGEIGSKVSIPGGGEMFLPKPIADSFKETIAARDILKDAVGSSSFGKASLKALDHVTSAFKKMVTLPFPAYWAQNMLGDRFMQAMQGAHAMDPGLFARAHAVLSGKSAITSANGIRLDKPALEKIIKQLGLNYNVSDFLGTIESFGDMNVDKFLAQKNSLFHNISQGAPFIPGVGDKAKAAAGLSQLHDKFQKTFDGFQRVTHFIHRFEKGDSIADAARAAQDAYFNYRDLSPVEQSLFRRFYMFYGYMSKATKHSMTSLITRPGNLTGQLHGVNALAEFFSDPDAAPTAEMHDSKLLNSVVTNEQLSRVIGRTPDGRPIKGRGFAAPLNAVMQQFSLQTPRNFSVGELIDTAGDSARRTIQKQFATANPAINAAAQVVSGKNLYFDKPLDAEFLRKLPSLNAAAERFAGYKHDELPVDLDAATKYFLKAVPDGKGRLIADPARMWILMNVVPGLGRATSMVGTMTNADVPTGVGALRSLLNVNLDDSDPSRTYLATRRDELDKFISANSVNQRLRNQKDDEE